ncbi:alpha/beta hydrolase [Variovorax sp. OV329]|uniref:alpha/beta hydrolase n=1 Tax=Variovorax sp. OV329 TaxID=1882825 RepID=UPI0008EBECEA|nr:alpha/beta hydrolase [Variovorax sp. OV329]SFM30101.1 Lysophospholipase, alpha-beta hydrolase superfamily [Variovorax sp. OV329]
MSAGTSRTLRSAGGETLALREWLATPASPRGVVHITHGLGEHAGRYAHVAHRLNALGFAVRAHDHFGHGQSSGARGGLPHGLRLNEDLALVVDDARAAFPGLPLVLLGHSMGGLVAASFVARGVRPVDALVLSSPALSPTLSAAQKGLIAVLSRVAPGLRMGNGLDAQDLSHDPAVATAYTGDPLNHDRIGARLARYLADEGAQVMAMAPRWPVPTLLLYAGADRLVRPEGSRAFAAASASSGQVQAVAFERHFHEIFNELDAQPVFEALERWLGERFGLGGDAAARA